jgi:hypothetical protein
MSTARAPSLQEERLTPSDVRLWEGPVGCGAFFFIVQDLMVARVFLLLLIIGVAFLNGILGQP